MTPPFSPYLSRPCLKHRTKEAKPPPVRLGDQTPPRKTGDVNPPLSVTLGFVRAGKFEHYLFPLFFLETPLKSFPPFPRHVLEFCTFDWRCRVVFVLKVSDLSLSPIPFLRSLASRTVFADETLLQLPLAFRVERLFRCFFLMSDSDLDFPEID